MAQADSSLEGKILAGLLDETQAFRNFSDTLQTEQTTLIDGDIAALTALSTEKQNQVALLNRMADERLKRINALGFGSDVNGMESWIAQSTTAIQDAWRTLLEVAAAARQLNQANGALIQTRMQHNQQALGALLAAANQSKLYGPDGQAHPPASGGTRGIIGKA